MNRKWKDVIAVVGSRLSQQLAAFAITPVAARELSPADFGAWALILVITGFATIFADAGLGIYVIREKNFCELTRSTIIWMGVFSGILIGLITASVAYPIASLLEISEWILGIVFIASSFVPHSVAAILLAELRKNLRFGTIFAVDSITALLSVVIASVLLSKGYGLYGLIIAAVAVPYSKMIWALSITGAPHLRFNRSVASAVLVYTSGLFGFSAINYWARRLDDVLIGSVLGPAALGPYSIAYRMMMLPITEVNRTVVNLVLPYLAPLQDRPAVVRRKLLLTIQLIGLIVTVPMTILWLCRDYIILVYLGEGWSSVADILGVFALVGLLQAVVNPLGVAYQVSGKTGVLFRMGLWNTGVTIAGAIVGVQFGVIGVVVAYAATNVIMLYPNVAVSLSVLEGGFGDWASKVWGFVIVPFLSAIICHLFDPIFPSQFKEIIVTLLVFFLVAWCFCRGEIVYVLANCRNERCGPAPTTADI